MGNIPNLIWYYVKFKRIGVTFCKYEIEKKITSSSPS